jgi:hypothetical protein
VRRGKGVRAGAGASRPARGGLTMRRPSGRVKPWTLPASTQPLVVTFR